MKYIKKSKTKKRKVKVEKKTLMWVFLFVFIVAQVFFTVQNATSGAKLKILEEKEEKLVKENRRLSRKLVETTALSSIEKKAEDLGFSKPQQIMYINTEEAVAQLQ